MTLKMVIPKGRMNQKVNQLLSDIGIHIRGSDRNYRPTSNDPSLELKLLKSQNIPKLIEMGQHDCGFAGHDWIQEQNADVIQVMDLGFDPVRLVACIPESLRWQELKKRHLIAVSEYRNLTHRYLDQHEIEYTYLQSYGATEVFPPEDADMIIDNTATGATLKANRLRIIDILLESTTRFIANKKAMDQLSTRTQIENLALLMASVLEGRKRVLLEMNCRNEDLERLVAALPAMKAPTVSKLYLQSGYAIKAAVPRDVVRELIPKIRSVGATDILETPIRKVIP